MTNSTLFFILATALLRALGTYADEPGALNDWSRTIRLEAGQRIWIRTDDRPIAEFLVAKVTDSAIRAVNVSELEVSKATKDQMVTRCASPKQRALIIRGELVDLDRICVKLDRNDILEVHRLIRGVPVESTLIGAGVGLALFFYPCGVVPQANGSSSGCHAGSAGWGALVGLAMHYLRRGKRTPIYVAAQVNGKTEAGKSVVTWQGEAAEALKNKVIKNATQ